MKQLLTNAVFMTVVVVSPLTLAQDDRAAQVEQRMEETKARLNLTDDQFVQIAPVLKNSMEAQRRILSKYGIDPESAGGFKGKLAPRQARAMREELESVRADTLKKLAATLNDEQLDEFKRMQEERKAEMRERIRGGAGRGSWESTSLNIGRPPLR
jgi:hypothetical protein